jgi:hypothetical protein
MSVASKACQQPFYMCAECVRGVRVCVHTCVSAIGCVCINVHVLTNCLGHTHENTHTHTHTHTHRNVADGDTRRCSNNVQKKRSNL